MSKKAPDNHIDNPDRYYPISCANCKLCWAHRDTHRCIHNGPFSGFQKDK